MPVVGARSAAIVLLLSVAAYSGNLGTYKVLQRFPVIYGGFDCSLTEVQPGVFVGTYDRTPNRIFQITGLGQYSVLATLKKAVEGNGAKGPLFPGSDGFLYGGTPNYGTSPSNLGVIFRTGASGALSVVTNQISLSSPVIEGADGNLYGTGLNSASNYGLYQVSRSGQLLAFYSFQDAVNPTDVLIAGPVTQASDGNFYGEASFSQSQYIFKSTPSGNFTKLYETTNFYPLGGLVEGPNGVLYGANTGTIFSITTTGQFQTIYAFGRASALPQAGLLFASDGNLYGIASWLYGGMGNGFPGIFRLAPDGSGYTIVHSFGSQFAGMVAPGPALMQASDGKLYGTLQTGLYAELFSLDLGLPAPRPAPSSFRPVQGVPGTRVQIAGQHLLGAVSVAFNGAPAAIFQNVGPNYITATVPAGAASGPITVTTGGGSAITTGSFTIR